jgi:hypothetical protein
MSLAADRPTGGDTPLADVSDVPLWMIFGDASVLAGALERLATETRSHEDLYAGFGNYAPDDEPMPAVTSTRDHGPRQ